MRPHLTFLPRYLLPESTNIDKVNAKAMRERGTVLTGNERRQERLARRRYKRLHGGSLKGYKPLHVRREKKPFDDARNEHGRVGNGSLMSKATLRRLKRKAQR